MSAIALDPLIAEAKRRARRRRWALGVIVVAAVAIAAILVTRSSPAVTPLDRFAAAVRDNLQMETVGSSHGVTQALGLDGNFWVTMDGGRGWEKAPAGGGALDGLGNPVFADPRHGWIVSTTGLLERSSDGGRTWKQLPPLPGGNRSVSFEHAQVIDGPSFLSPTVGFIATSSFSFKHPGLFATDDGGETWHARALPPAGRHINWFANPLRGFTFGGSSVYSTKDGARTWSPLFHASHCLGGPSVAGVFGRTLVITCPHGAWNPLPGHLSFYVSRDDGATWSERPAVPWGSFSAVSASTWFVASPSGGLLVTTSAGRSWHVVHPHGLPAHWRIWVGDFTSRNAGWAVFRHDQPGLLARYKRCGATRPRGQGWKCNMDPRFDPVRSPRGVLMRTTDGGRDWTPAGPPKPKDPKRK